MSSAPGERGLRLQGPTGGRVPDDVFRVLIDPSVTSIPAYAFFQCKKLAEVELCEGLVEIGANSFAYCGHSITKLNIPNSLRRICERAFRGSLRCPIHLNDGIESLGENAFRACIFTNFRVPPLITTIPEGMLNGCSSMFSVEISEVVTDIGHYAFFHCQCLRNIAFPPNAVVFGGKLFKDGSDFHRLFGSEARIIRELQHRFDGLPIHNLVYYQTYNQGVLHILIAAINMRSDQQQTLCSELDPTGNQQDCLGMTPLHILACSSVHDLELYRLIVENYPANLITEDRWGALPLLYAFWGAAPTEIIQFLLKSYQSLYPGHVFNWTMMLKTMGRTDTPKESIEKLLSVKQMHFPEQPIDWGYLLDKFARPSCQSVRTCFHKRMQFLVMCGMSAHVESLAFKVWRDYITSMIHNAADFKWGNDNFHIIQRIRDKIAHFDEEYAKLKEITTILELALWKLRMNENIPHDNATPSRKKLKADNSSVRNQQRVIVELIL
jgi:hypothetical protein